MSVISVLPATLAQTPPPPTAAHAAAPVQESVESDGAGQRS